MLTRKTRPRKRADQSGSIITTIPLISFVYFLAPAASQPNLKLVTSHEKFSNNFKIYLRPPIQVFARAQDYFRVGPPPLLRLHARFQSFFLDVSWRVRRSLFLALRLLLSPPPSLNQPSPPLPRTPSTLMPIPPSSLLCLCASRRGKAHCRIERLSPVAAHILVDLPAPPPAQRHSSSKKGNHPWPVPSPLGRPSSPSTQRIPAILPQGNPSPPPSRPSPKSLRPGTRGLARNQINSSAPLKSKADRAVK